MVFKILFGISIVLNIVLMLLVGFYAGRDSERDKRETEKWPESTLRDAKEVFKGK
jgi:hypothetical protein